MPITRPEADKPINPPALTRHQLSLLASNQFGALLAAGFSASDVRATPSDRRALAMLAIATAHDAVRADLYGLAQSALDDAQGHIRALIAAEREADQ